MVCSWVFSRLKKKNRLIKPICSIIINSLIQFNLSQKRDKKE